MNKKMFYEAPDAELIELNLEEGVIMGSGDSTETPTPEEDENF